MKKILIAIGIVILLLFIIKQKDMTLRQSFLKVIYPLVMRFSKDGGNGKILANKEHISPQQSFYNLHATLNNGEQINFQSFKGKKVLIVNTASDCGYTDQYDDLQKLYAAQKENLIVLGFPANDFKEQESGSDADIAKFCRANYGVTFPLMQKSSVVTSSRHSPKEKEDEATLHQNEIFQWLTDKNKNGWNNQLPQWNFSKYLVDENGVLVNYFGPAVSPTGDIITKAIAR